MKHVFAAVAVLLAIARLAVAQENSFYLNSQVVNSPPDNPPYGNATNFVNLSSITVTEGEPFNFFGVYNFTNRGTMTADIGFNFYFTPPVNGTNAPATSFNNTTVGTVNAGKGTVPGLVSPDSAPPVFYPQTQIWATNLVNHGLINDSVAGNLSLTGGNLDLSRGTVNFQGFDQSVSPADGPPFGFFDVDWGAGTQNNVLRAGNFSFPTTTSPASSGSNETGGETFTLALSSTNAYSRVDNVSPSNSIFQAIFIANQGPAQVTASFLPSTGGSADVLDNVAVGWTMQATNYFGSVSTFRFYLEDTLPTASGAGVGSNQITLGGAFLYGPSNYSITLRPPNGFNPQIGSNYDTTIFDTPKAFPTNGTRSVAQNLYSFWNLDLLPVTFEPDPMDPQQTYSNVPGRVVINASNLDLTLSTLKGPNYLNLVTSNLVSSANADLEFPVSDLWVGATNGTLAVSNLVIPFLSRPTGSLALYSAVWSNIYDTNMVSTNGTNVTTNMFSVTNLYSILMVGDVLSNNGGTFQEHVTLNATNVLLSDILNITSNLNVTAQNFTLTSNTPPMLPAGINLNSTGILWSPSFPDLENFTNWGSIAVGNTTFFSHRASPFFPSPSDSPYQTFVNHGNIVSQGGNLFWSDYFENSGVGGVLATNTSFSGELSIQANTALLGNDHMTATNGDVVFNIGSLTITNTYLEADGSMYLVVTNQITDGAPLTGNLWQFGDGIYMPIKPANGDLLGTSITLISPNNALVEVEWPGVDYGPVLKGFSDNAVVGELALFGENKNSAFHFIAAGAQSAIYVDLLELEGAVTNANALQIDSNMKIYYSRAMRGSTDVSALLNNGVNLIQVSGFVGPFATPKPSALSVPLAITYSNPQKTPMVSWESVANANNILYSSPTPVTGPWTQVTNFVVGPTSFPISVPVSALSNAASYYKLGVVPILQ